MTTRTHIRTKIRKEVKALLDGKLGEDYKVYSSKMSSVNHDATRALVDMHFQNDQTRQISTLTNSGDERRNHVVSLYFRVQRSGIDEQLADLLDLDEVRVIEAIYGYDWLHLLEDMPELVQVTFSDDGTAGRTLGIIVLRLDLEYCINKFNPTRPIQ